MKIKFQQSTLLIILLSLGQFSFATPAQDRTVEELIQVAELKKVTLDSMKDLNLESIGTTKEDFWLKFEPEVKKIYKQVLSNEEVEASIKFYKTPEGKSLLTKLPIIMKLSSAASIKILLGDESPE